jgi:outer membrane protein OmpA-like peptidoglycan-associated protein
VQISGHTDDNGTDEHNLDLSRRRAEAVLDYLVAHGEDPERFVVIGYGESRPVADNGTPEGEARNRRIEFTALEE